MENLKSKSEIYQEVKNFIENKATPEQLKMMLIESIDNGDESLYLNISFF